MKTSTSQYQHWQEVILIIEFKAYNSYINAERLYPDGIVIYFGNAGITPVNGTTYSIAVNANDGNIYGSVTPIWPEINVSNITTGGLTLTFSNYVSLNNDTLSITGPGITESPTLTYGPTTTVNAPTGIPQNKNYSFWLFSSTFTIDNNKTYSLTLTSATSTFNPVTVNFGLPYISISNLTITGFTVRFYNDYTSANNDNLSITGGGLTNTPKLTYVYQSIKPEPGYEVTQDYTFSSDFTPSFTLVLDNNYNLTLWTEGGSVARSTVPFSIFSPVPPAPCFREGSQILCDISGVETYRAIETLRPGMLVKTLTSGLVPITMIGHTTLKNPGHAERIQNRLYKCSKDKYPTLFEDLYITGCHSILVDDLSEAQKEATLAQLERIFITEDKYRLMACIDERATPHIDNASYTIWHIALANEEYYHNYGIWANGLCVETCSKRYLKELSGMTLIE